METKRGWWHYGIIFILIAQLGWYALRLNDTFNDGRMHLNWGPAFWLLKAQSMHQVDFWTDGHWGVVSEATSTPQGIAPSSWYLSHPQLIAVPLYIWTGIFGFGEWVVRSLSIILILLTTIILWWAVRERHSSKQATLFTAAWAALPVMIVFGRKLDQEPLVYLFLALAFLGYERFLSGRHPWPWLWLGAMFGLVWSDWSGWVFAGLFFLALLVSARWHAPSKKLLLATFLGGAAGAGVVVVQTIATQSGVDGGTWNSLVGLYKYRSGGSLAGLWKFWLNKQFIYWSKNFTVLVGGAGALWFLGARWREFRSRRLRFVWENGLPLPQLFLLVAVGTLLYALLLRQATSIHLYYQMFYGLLVAWGLVEIWQWGEKKLSPAGYGWRWWLAVALCLSWLIYSGLSVLFLDLRVGFGTSADISLLKKIIRLPPNSTVTVMAPEQLNEWLDNPNIVYYAGRQLRVTPADRVATGDFVLIMNEKVDEKTASLAVASGQKAKFYVKNCSPLFCLVERVSK